MQLRSTETRTKALATCFFEEVAVRAVAEGMFSLPDAEGASLPPPVGEDSFQSRMARSFINYTQNDDSSN